MRVYTPIIKTRENLVGEVFGRLSVVSLLGSYRNRHYWRCACACGGTTDVPTSSLKVGNTASCGCIAPEKTRIRSTTHGLSAHPLYGVWQRMLQRCEDANCGDYTYYGARGITVCAAWHDFPVFLNDVGERPTGATLERRDNSKGYGPDNFRWATRLEQMQNTRSTRALTYQGETKSLATWARAFGIQPSTLRARLDRLCYSVEDALTKTPKSGQMLNGKTWTENRKELR